MKRQISILFLFFFFQIGCYAQSVRIEGQILDNNTKTPIAFAAIKVPNSSIGTISDDKGRFAFDIPEGIMAVEFRHIAYKKALLSIDRANNKKIFLEPNVTELKEITIEGMTPQRILFNALKAAPKNYIQGDYYVKTTRLSKKNIQRRLNYLGFCEGIYQCNGVKGRNSRFEQNKANYYYSDSIQKHTFKYKGFEDIVLSLYKENKKAFKKDKLSVFDDFDYKLKIIYDENGEEQDYFITKRTKASYKKRKNMMLTIWNYHIDAKTLAIKQVEILGDTSKVAYASFMGMHMKLLASYFIYNYQKSDSGYYLENSMMKTLHERDNENSSKVVKNIFKLSNDNTLEEHVEMYNVNEISFSVDSLDLNLKKDVYMPLYEMKELDIFYPILNENKQYY
ncbi:MAG: hypothetical protein H6Q15_775 [Bacteroidetes bacterium]|nr:hypothetical protein [Bacteroidota bacterium]